MRISDWSSDVCSSDLLTAVENARDYCWAFTNSIRGGLTLYFPDGRYCLSGGIEFARSYFTVAVQSDQVWLESFRTTSGQAISCNGLTYDSTSGVYNFTFGGAYIRSEARRVGKEIVSTLRPRRSPTHKKK